jgi:hypothetical protein
MTRFITYDFKKVFDYMTYLLTTDIGIDRSNGFGFRVYIGQELTPTETARGPHHFYTTLFAPTEKSSLHPQKFMEGFEFFNQGSICPVNCPEDDGGLIK